MRKLLRRGVWFLIPLALALTACGSGGSDSMPVLTGARAQRFIAASADRAEDAGTARMRGEVTVEVQGERRTISMEGALDFRSGAMQFGMDMSELGLAAGNGLEMEMRVVDGVSYMRFVSLPDEMREELEAFTGGRSWISIDPAAFGIQTPGTSGLNQSSPSSSVAALRGIDDVRRVGVEDVGGEPTTHYEGRIDVAKALERLPADLRGDIESLRMLSQDWAVDVWVDADGRVRKMEIGIDGAAMSMHMSFEFSDFGADIDLSAPPADDVVDFAQVFGNLGLGTPRPSV
jgi:hypothetical protein